MKKEKVNMTSIPSDAEATITIGGAFYQRLNKLMIDYGDALGKDNLIQSMYKIQRGNIPKNDALTFNLETMMILLKGVEEAFEEAGATTHTEIEMEVPDDFKVHKDIFKDITPNKD